MNGSKSRAALLEFMDYLSRKGLINKTTAGARKAAVNNVMGILDDEEADDISQVNLDELMSRFSNLHGSRYTPDSLGTYKSRVKSSIDDFLNYVQNPMTFRPGLHASGRKTVERARANETRPIPTSARGEADRKPSANPSMPFGSSTILPIPLRADLTVFIQGLPFDLTPAEAGKIANVIRAMAVES